MTTARDQVQIKWNLQETLARLGIDPKDFAWDARIYPNSLDLILKGTSTRIGLDTLAGILTALGTTDISQVLTITMGGNKDGEGTMEQGPGGA
jgi:predicted transcriptional regulator